VLRSVLMGGFYANPANRANAANEDCPQRRQVTAAVIPPLVLARVGPGPNPAVQAWGEGGFVKAIPITNLSGIAMPVA